MLLPLFSTLYQGLRIQSWSVFLAIIYCGLGIYALLLATGKVQKGLVGNINRARRGGLIAFGLGFLVLGFYYAAHEYYLTTDEGQQMQQLEEQMQRQMYQDRRTR